LHKNKLAVTCFDAPSDFIADKIRSAQHRAGLEIRIKKLKNVLVLGVD